jgi:hypothetical protein
MTLTGQRAPHRDPKQFSIVDRDESEHATGSTRRRLGAAEKNGRALKVMYQWEYQRTRATSKVGSSGVVLRSTRNEQGLLTVGNA